MRSFRKPRQIKRKRPIYRNKFFWLVLAFLILAGAAFYLLVFSSYLQITKIEITGNQKIQNSALEDILSQNYKKKLLFFETKSIILANIGGASKSILNSFPAIENIKLKKKFPNALSLNVVERSPVAKFCVGNFNTEISGCYLIDKNGVIFEQTDINKNTLIIRQESASNQTLGTEVIGKARVGQLLNVQLKTAEKEKITIAEYWLSEEKLVGVTQDGWQMYFDPQKDILDQAENLLIAFQEKVPADKIADLEYIDLRFGSKIFIKYK